MFFLCKSAELGEYKCVYIQSTTNVIITFLALSHKIDRWSFKWKYLPQRLTQTAKLILLWDSGCLSMILHPFLDVKKMAKRLPFVTKSLSILHL